MQQKEDAVIQVKDLYKIYGRGEGLRVKRCEL